MAALDEVMTRQCPACRDAVPEAPFCGACGAEFSAAVDARTTLLRPRVYATAHRESVWTPRISSTYLPRLPDRARKPFRFGLILVLVIIGLLAAARLNGPLGVTATIGWPLLFLIYIWETDVFRDVPRRILLTAGLLGIGLGSGWWLVAGRWLAGSYGVSTGAALMLRDVLNVGLVITAVGSILLVVPAVVARIFPVPVREALDGFVIGAFGALWYATAATTTMVAPQFVEGLIEEHSTSRMLGDAITYGVASPIVTVAAGGCWGCACGFSRTAGRAPTRTERRRRCGREGR